MKIAVLGARGFLGKYLTGYLYSVGHTVLPVTRDTVNLENYHLVDHWLETNRPEVVINCAISGGGARVNDINYSDVQRDLGVFMNFYNSAWTGRYINIGSGAEFDRRHPITNAVEEDILFNHPLESYGFVKNAISRLCLNRENFYTLRLFGCFDRSEPSNRLFKKFLFDKSIVVNDRYFDYISASDFARIINYYCESNILLKDINCVYQEKYKLSQILYMLDYTSVPNLAGPYLENAYTGLGKKLASLPIELMGLEFGLKNYE